MSPLRHIDVTVTYTVIVTSQLHHQDIFSMTLSLTNPYEPQYSLPISYPEERQKEQTDILFFFSFLDPRWIRNSGHYSRTFFPNVLFVYFYFPHDYAFEPHTMDGVILPPPLRRRMREKERRETLQTITEQIPSIYQIFF